MADFFNNIDPLKGLYNLNIPGVLQPDNLESYVTGGQIAGGVEGLLKGLEASKNRPAFFALPTIAGSTYLGGKSGGQTALSNVANMAKLRQDLIKSGIDITKGQYDVQKAPFELANIAYQASQGQFDANARNNLMNLIKSLPVEQQLQALADPKTWYTKTLEAGMPTTDIKEYERSLKDPGLKQYLLDVNRSKDQNKGPFAKIPMANVDTEQSNLPEFVKRYNAGDPTAYDFLVMKKEKEPILTKGEQIKKELTPLQLEIDKKFAEDLVEFTVGGGFSDVQKNLTQLDLAKETLTNAPKDSITGRLIGIQDDSGILKYTNPKAQNVKEQIQEIAQRNLRLILGPQFTAKEGEQLINRVYNPALPQDVNIQRLNLLQEQILSAAKSKQEAVDYYNEYGTLAGFKGKLYKDSTDFLNDYNSKLKGLETSKETTQTPSRFKEGARTKSKSGKPMIFKNNRWEYE